VRSDHSLTALALPTMTASVDGRALWPRTAVDGDRSEVRRPARSAKSGETLAERVSLLRSTEPAREKDDSGDEQKVVPSKQHVLDAEREELQRRQGLRRAVYAVREGGGRCGHHEHHECGDDA